MRSWIITGWLLPGLVAGLLIAGGRTAAGAQPKAKAAPAAGKHPRANDGAITLKIKTALLADKVVPGMKVHVETKNGVVTLSGQVDNPTQKSRAAQIAKKTKGVNEVINHLTIKPRVPGKRGAGAVLNDAAVTAKIKTALLADKVAPGMKVNVDTKLGVVTLSGQVDGDAQKKRAEEIAKKTKGVKSVINQLTIKPKIPG